MLLIDGRDRLATLGPEEVVVELARRVRYLFELVWMKFRLQIDVFLRGFVLSQRDGGLECVVNLPSIPSTVFIISVIMLLCKFEEAVFISINFVLRTLEVDTPDLLGCFPIEWWILKKSQARHTKCYIWMWTYNTN